MTTSLYNDAINFSVGNVAHPTYQYIKQYPQEANGNYSVTAAQGPTNTF